MRPPSDLKAVIFSGILGLLVAILGAVAQYILSKRKDEMVRRQTAALQRLQDQIEELYGPLHGLTQRLGTIYDLVCQKLPTTDKGTVDPARFGAADWEIASFFIDEYFLPLHTEVAEILRNKAHLLEAGDLPESFRLFINHEAQFECLYRLWKVKEIPWVPSAADVEWPRQFERDVAATLHRLRECQEQYLIDLSGAAKVNSNASDDGL